MEAGISTDAGAAPSDGGLSVLGSNEYQVIFDNAMVGIVYTVDRNIVRCNRRFEEMFGYAPGQLNGQSLRLLYKDDEQFDSIGRVGYHLIALSGIYEDERFMVRRDGKPLWIKWSGKALDRNDPIKGTLWICLDTSRRKLAEESLNLANRQLEQKVQERTADLRRINEALEAENDRRRYSEETARTQQIELARMARISTMGEMAATLAHQLGQPLSSSLNYLHGSLLRMRSGEYDRDEIIEALEKAVRHTQQAGEIIQHVRQFMRKHAPERMAMQSVNALIADCTGFLEFELKQEGIVVDLALESDLPEAPFDRIEIEQVMINLIRNAIEAMRTTPAEHRRLFIASRKVDGGVQVEVIDAGAGITEADRERLFEPYFTTKPDGMGLGLVICRSIIEAHGGRLQLASSDAHGSVFAFFLPA